MKRRPEKMLKMKDDPDELLKTKVKLRPRIVDPDGCLKTKDLLEIPGKTLDVIEKTYGYGAVSNQMTQGQLLFASFAQPYA